MEFLQELSGYKIHTVTHELFRLDGGAMFGSVPKNLWSKKITPDQENCIPLCTRSLLLEGHGRKILIDCGMGKKWSEKERAIFGIKEQEPLSALYDATDLILTHLHFDHAGGVSHLANEKALLSFPNATIYLQKANLENALSPTVKERASYRNENVLPVKNHSRLILTEGSSEILPHVFVHRADGHTVGLQWIEIRGEAESIFYPSDIIPTVAHIPAPYHLGYDRFGELAITDKVLLLTKAANRKARIVFEHDSTTVSVKVRESSPGSFEVESASSNVL